jgi:hypothetical protein
MNWSLRRLGLCPDRVGSETQPTLSRPGRVGDPTYSGDRVGSETQPTLVAAGGRVRIGVHRRANNSLAGRCTPRSAAEDTARRKTAWAADRSRRIPGGARGTTTCRNSGLHARRSEGVRKAARNLRRGIRSSAALLTGILPSPQTSRIAWVSHAVAHGSNTSSGNRALACPRLIISARELNSCGRRHGTSRLWVFLLPSQSVYNPRTPNTTPDPGEDHSGGRSFSLNGRLRNTIFCGQLTQASWTCNLDRGNVLLSSKATDAQGEA